MIQQKFGQFSQLEDENPTGSQTQTEMPPIAGSPMPNAGMKNKTMGSVFPAKDDPSAKQFAGRNASAKRLKGLPNRSPLGPITGGPQKPQARPQQPQQRPGMQQGQQQQPNQDTGTGDQWMGELWQGLTLNEQPQGGFAMGGAVNPGGSNSAMDMYNQVTQELESGGVNGYAHGGMVEQSREIASKGRNGDTMLMHIQPGELEGLQSLLGPVTINPETGNPEAFGIAAALMLAAGLTASGAAVGAIVDGEDGAKRGAMLGLTAGAVIASAGAASAPAAAGTSAAAAATAPTVAASAVPSILPSILSGGSLAVPGSVAPGILGAGGAGAGTSFLAPGITSSIASSVTPAAAGMSKAGLAKAAARGLSSLTSQGQQEQQAPMATPPSMPAPSPLGNIPSPYEKMRQRRSGISSLPGSRSII